jgi:hypothetical protein
MNQRASGVPFLILDVSPFSELLLFPQKFFTFPVRSTIAPEKEINIKTVTNESPKIVNHETHSFARDREPKVPITLILNMKTGSRTPKARLQHPCH